MPLLQVARLLERWQHKCIAFTGTVREVSVISDGHEGQIQTADAMTWTELLAKLANSYQPRQSSVCFCGFRELQVKSSRSEVTWKPLIAGMSIAYR